jgi:AhpD family alkylhydroperoxidase
MQVHSVELESMAIQATKETAITSAPGATAHASGTSPDHLYPVPTRALNEKRSELAPAPLAAFHAFSKSVFAEGALSTQIKQLVAVAVAHTTQCPYCIRSHTAAALNAGATEEQIMEAIWVAAEMRAGGAYAHSLIALDAMSQPRR